MTAATPLDIETPSGKSSGDENFPVGSFLLPRRLRPHVATYYAFARAIDDIADNPGATPEEKLARLDAMERALDGERTGAATEKATRLRASLIATSVDFAHARDLVSAFRQDAVKGRYASWDELMDYCNRSAAPVGRYLLALHGEDRAGFRQSDALCNALQVINHLQDCAADYRQLDRIYLPGERGDSILEERMRDGIPLPQGTWSRLLAAADALGVPPPPPVAAAGRNAPRPAGCS